jgi:hypothetical protein
MLFSQLLCGDVMKLLIFTFFQMLFLMFIGVFRPQDVMVGAYAAVALNYANFYVDFLAVKYSLTFSKGCLWHHVRLFWFCWSIGESWAYWLWTVKLRAKISVILLVNRFKTMILAVYIWFLVLIRRKI